LPADYDLDADDDLLRLVGDAAERERAWRLTLHMLEMARDDYEVRQVAIEALETLLRESGDALVDELEVAIRTDKRLREAIQGIYLSGKVEDLAKREGLRR
jgi:hypothetical protein